MAPNYQTRPSTVNKKNEKEILEKIYNRIKIAQKPKYKIGQHVRISLLKTLFDKSYTRRWSTEIFTIKRIKHGNPCVYILQDYLNQEIKGTWYEEEISATAHPHIFPVEKILREKGDKVYVKFLGFDSSHNCWMSKKDIQ